MVELAPRHKLYHLEWPRLKHEENSNRGDHEAVREGYHWTDHDEQLDADGVSWNTHWLRPLLHDGFIDPLGKLHSHTPISQMRSHEVARLRTKDGYRIRRSIKGVRHAQKLGLGVEHECKSPHYTHRYFEKLAERAIDASEKGLWIKAYPHFAHSLIPAHEVGLTTVLLAHGMRASKLLKPHIDLRRGKVNWI